MLLSCPHCGRRPVAEFRYGGENGMGRPNGDEVLDAATLADRLYAFDNPKGPSREWWQHVAGCRAWFALSRDTATDQILDAER
jgi:heterotetrameric sarcosine oxidase delta subunit